MDNSTSGIPEKRSLSLSNGPSFRRSTGSRPSSGGSGGGTLDPGGGTTYHLPHTKIVLYKDEKGYGMKVSGDNPVYVQSVKEGGAAERAGLHSGDKIIKVNGVTVTHSTHIEVVELIKSGSQVELTVQQHPAHRNSSAISPLHPSSPSNTMASPPPSRPLHHHHSAPARDRITGPQPVDYKKQVELENERLQMTRVMLEHEQNYVEMLRSDLARRHDRQESELLRQLSSAERRVHTLQQQIVALTSANANASTLTPTSASTTTDNKQPTILPLSRHLVDFPPGYEGDHPPPLPSRNPPRAPPSSTGGVPPPHSPPPLPPRQYLLQTDKLTSAADLLLSASTSNNCTIGTPVHKHHRTKSSPDTLSASSMAEASKRLIDTESLHELSIGGAKRTRGGVAWDVDSPRSTPPGTPPPPYAIPPATASAAASGAVPDEISDITPDDTDKAGDPGVVDPSGVVISPPGSVQPPIISMEDDDMSDQEISQLEDHGPFKSLNKLWNHHAHLAVFMNYVISNSDPSSLLFYLVTDLYKEGNAKEMKKWAYEIHSSFLVPCAPLRLNNVDENVAREIDDCLLKESDKEEIMRKIFWKARLKAKEELNEQLADFQQKRTAGLGMLFGPSDAQLEDSINDKTKELKIVETILVPKMEPFLSEMESEGGAGGVVDGKRFTTAAALGTILGKKFGLRGQHFSALIERCPTFVSKDKSLKSKLIGKSRKVTLMGHHFVAHQYFIVTYCNHCQLIIWGIGPQGYQCSNCHLNIHRHCVKVLDENCPGPMVKKEKGNDRISKFMEKIRPENTRRKPSSLSLGTDRLRRQHEEKDDTGTLTDNEAGGDRLSSSLGARGSGGGTGGQERRPDPVREAVEERTGGGRGGGTASDTHNDEDHHNQSHHELSHIAKPKSSAATINRSESYKERIPNKRQLRERRKTSDPNLSKTNNDVDIDNQTLTCHANSGSSSNSSLSTSRSLDSPSNSLEAVSGGGRGTGGEGAAPTNGSYGGGSGGVPQWDSDLEAEPDPPDWTRVVPEDILSNLSAMEKKRQEVINELFHTERSHVRGLKVLDQVFYRPMRDQQILPVDQMQLLFANLDEMLQMHLQFNNSMKARRKETPVVSDVGDLILNMFDGAEGEVFQRAAATFCARQQIALEALKERRRKDQKLNNFLTDAEGSPLCRRLQLKDIIPTGMLRLTKYPLLFENLAKYTPHGTEEAANVQRAVERSKQILNFVDKAVKEASDQHRLQEIQRRLDKTPFDKADNPLANEFRNLDLTKHRLIHEGALVWRIASRPKPIDLHVLLLEDVIILLQKQDEKYVLKFYSATQFYSPVIKVSTVLVRTNAVDKTGLFLVNTSQNGAQIYDLIATTPQEKRKWFKHISEAAEAYKQRDGRNRRADAAAAAAAAQQDLDNDHNHDKTKDMEDSTPCGADLLSPPRGATNGHGHGHDDSPSPNSETTPLPPSGDTTPQASPSPSPSSAATPHPDTPESIARRMGDSLSPSPSLSRKVAEPLRLTTAESSLIQPSEVLISQRPVLTAEPVLTPLEKLRRKDEAISQALAEKQQLVADILHVPKDEFDTIAEMAGEPATEKEASELILAAVNQDGHFGTRGALMMEPRVPKWPSAPNQLSAMVNEALRVTEEDAVSAGVTPSRGGVAGVGRGATGAGIAPHKLNAIATSLNAQLTQLLSVLVQRDDERERLRRELQRSREQLHAMHEQRQPGAAAASAATDEQLATEPGAVVEMVQPGEETGQTSENATTVPNTATTTAQEVFVDALSGEAESHLEAAGDGEEGGLDHCSQMAGGGEVAASVD